MSTTEPPDESTITPIVLYGTIIAFGVLIFLNFLYAYLFCKIIKPDIGFHVYRQRFPRTPYFIYALSVVFNFKFGRVLYTRLFGIDNFECEFNNPARVKCMKTILSIVNMVCCLLVIIAVDIIGLIRYHWGN